MVITVLLISVILLLCLWSKLFSRGVDKSEVSSLEKFSTLYRSSVNKVTRPSSKWVNKGVNQVLGWCEKAAKGGRSCVEVSLYEYSYEDYLDEIVKSLRDDHKLTVTTNSLLMTVGGWDK